jgi:hypothetical protein
MVTLVECFCENSRAAMGHYVDCSVMNSGITASMADAVLIHRSYA